MKLYLVHCGYYDAEAGFSVYESHTNFFVVAADPQTARAQVKSRKEFTTKRMHVDGLVEVNAVQGHKVTLMPSTDLNDDIQIIKHRDLAPPSARPPAQPTTAPSV